MRVQIGTPVTQGLGLGGFLGLVRLVPWLLSAACSRVQRDA